jgi:hypothetical protein
VYIDAVSVPCDSGDVFHCNDNKGRCIPLSMRCDGNRWQCPKNADEEGCGKYTSNCVEYQKHKLRIHVEPHH